MCFEVRSLTRQHRVIRRVRFVETIARKELDIVEKLIRDLARDHPALVRAINERVVLLQ